MQRLSEQFGGLVYLVSGAALAGIGLLALIHMTNNIWPIDPNRLDLLRGLAQDQLTAADILDAANTEVLVAFLSLVLLTVTGLALPLVYYLNKRFALLIIDKHGLILVRQAMWFGLWVAFCTWLQMNRALNWAVALMSLVVLVFLSCCCKFAAKCWPIRGCLGGKNERPGIAVSSVAQCGPAVENAGSF